MAKAAWVTCFLIGAAGVLALGCSGDDGGESGGVTGGATATGGDSGAGAATGVAGGSGGNDPGTTGTELGPGELCAPCEQSSDCGGEADRCVIFHDYDESFCGRDCTSTACPQGYQCESMPGPDQATLQQCIPTRGRCPPDGAGSVNTDPPPPPPGSCDPSFRGPFCQNDRIIGFVPSNAPAHPTKEEVRQ